MVGFGEWSDWVGALLRGTAFYWWLLLAMSPQIRVAPLRLLAGGRHILVENPDEMILAFVVMTLVKRFAREHKSDEPKFGVVPFAIALVGFEERVGVCEKRVFEAYVCYVIKEPVEVDLSLVFEEEVVNKLPALL